MEKLVILEFLVQDVAIHIYDIKPEADVDEDYIRKLGFNPDYCSWYFGCNAEVINHKEVLE